MSRYSVHKNYTCVDGRQMRHDPQTDDPELQTDIGRCPDCDGESCGKVERQADEDGMTPEYAAEVRAAHPGITDAGVASFWRARHLPTD